MKKLDQLDTSNRTTLHEELTDRLRTMIVEGVLSAGEKVPERELCEKLGVSRRPMREALKVLAADGLLTLQPNRGARVRAITQKEIEELFPVMGALEALAGELACANITPVDLQNIRDSHERMLDCYRQSDMPGYFTHNQRIHELIMEVADNATLVTLYQSLAVRVRRARYMANMSPEHWQQAVEEHEQILSALAERRPARLATILREHLDNKMVTVRQWLEDQPGEDQTGSEGST